jgi:tRNA(Ile)-lysidine synthase
VLFNLLRGTGSAGLSSLRAERPFYGGQLLRPLLHASKTEILEYARHHALSWVEDPSNADVTYARNQIRETLIPALNEFRPDAVRNIARAASNLEQENSLLREIAISDLAEVREQPRHVIDHSHALCVDDIQMLSPARQANLLRFWLGSLQLHVPSKALTEELLKAVMNPPASTAVLQEEGCQYRFFRGYLYVMPAMAENPGFQPVEWQDPATPLDLHDARVQIGATRKLQQFYSSCRDGSLRLESREALVNPQAVQGHSLNLKKWLQDAGVPPWRRRNLPILTLRQAQRDVVLAPVDQSVETDWVELRQEVA